MEDKKQIYVWDLFIRIFHWSLVVFFFAAFATGDDKNSLHRYVGYAVLGLVAARIVWGVVGSPHARFVDFVCSPGKALSYLRSLATGTPAYYSGHNPAAAWMIIFLLIGSLVVCLSGYAAYAAREMKPILGIDTELSIVVSAYADDDENEEREHAEEGKRHGAERERHRDNDDAEEESVWGDVHEASAQCMLLAIIVHVVGVAVSSVRHGENLAKAMLTGKKSLHVS